jgi:hypothetical protein
MKLSEAKSIGKKIIFVTFCLMLFLIFTTLSYGRPDPKKLRGDPWEHMLSPKPDNDNNLDLVVLVINSHFCLVFKSQSRVESLNHLNKSRDQQSASSIKQSSLYINETKSKK